jgi:hypothetical protein
MNANKNNKFSLFRNSALAKVKQQPKSSGAGQRRALLETRRSILAKLSMRMRRGKYFCAFDEICSNL